MMWFLSRFNISSELMSKRLGGILSSKLSNRRSSVTCERLLARVGRSEVRRKSFASQDNDSNSRG